MRYVHRYATVQTNRGRTADGRHVVWHRISDCYDALFVERTDMPGVYDLWERYVLIRKGEVWVC
jgi:hypothetical protein